MTAAQPGELREALAERLIPFVWSTGDVDAVLAEIMPRITAWHEKEAKRMARERVAEEARKTALAWQWKAWADLPRTANPIATGQYVTEWLRARAAALTVDDQPVQP